MIPVTSSILNLHEAIQAVIGWEDIHLNRFKIRGQLYGVPRDRGMSFFSRSDRLQLIDFAFCEHDRFVYEYVFYFRWIHDIRIEKVFDSASLSLPTCIAGVGACPAEESGPADHFMQRLDEHSIVDTLEWLQDSLDDNVPMADMREELITDLLRVERSDLDPGSLGLHLSEAHKLLNHGQSAMVTAQVNEFVDNARQCPDCHRYLGCKGHHEVVLLYRVHGEFQIIAEIQHFG